MKLAAEIMAWAAFCAVVGLLSVWPRYGIVDTDKAVVTVTFSHAAKRVGECTRLSQEELNKLPPNMRKPADCPRERHPVRIELRAGGALLYEDVLLPSGIWSDGKANVYRRVEVAAGAQDLFVGMNDSGGDAGLDYTKSVHLDIAPGRNIVIQFDKESGQFTIH